MRLFLGIRPDREAEAALGRRLADLQRGLGDLANALRWTPLANVHITLHFLGEVGEAQAARLGDALVEPLDVAPFHASVGDVVALPASGPPRVVGLGVDAGRAEIVRVHAELAARLATAGMATESRPFSPHVTLARVGERERRQARGLRERLVQIHLDPVEWTVPAVALVQSDLSGPVPRYEAIREVPLGRVS